MILVTGASGTIGRLVVEGLLSAGARVRTMTRSSTWSVPGAEHVRADLDEPASLPPALHGVERVLMIAPGSPALPRQDAALIEAALQAGVRRMVKLSAFGADLVPRLPIGQWHGEGERALQGSNLEWTLLRPTAFASNALQWASAIRTGAPLPLSTGAGRVAVVDPRDVAEVARIALITDRCLGQALSLDGPELLSAADQVAILGQALGRRIDTVALSPEEARQQLVSAGLPLDLVEAYAAGMAFVRAGGAERRTETLASLLGRPPRRFEDWVRDHLSAFLA